MPHRAQMVVTDLTFERTRLLWSTQRGALARESVTRRDLWSGAGFHRPRHGGIARTIQKTVGPPLRRGQKNA